MSAGPVAPAAAYAERHRGDYRATWWIRAQTEPTLRADLVGLGIWLGWVGADDKEEPAVEAVIERLRHEGEGILLIFDNAIDANSLEAYLPRGGREQVRGLVERAPTLVRWFIVDAGAITDIDYSAAQSIRDLIDDLRRRGVGIVFARVSSYLRSDMDRHGITAVIEETLKLAA